MSSMIAIISGEIMNYVLSSMEAAGKLEPHDSHGVGGNFCTFSCLKSLLDWPSAKHVCHIASFINANTTQESTTGSDHGHC